MKKFSLLILAIATVLMSFISCITMSAANDIPDTYIVDGQFNINKPFEILGQVEFDGKNFIAMPFGIPVESTSNDCRFIDFIAKAKTMYPTAQAFINISHDIKYDEKVLLFWNEMSVTNMYRATAVRNK